jgi:hypothetical protein
MRTVVLIDYTLAGHHLSFIRTCSQLLLEMDCQVLCMTPESEQVKKWVHENCTSLTHQFFNYDYTPYSLKAPGGRTTSMLHSFQTWRHDKKEIRKATKQDQLKVDLVFYAWLDNHFAGFVHPFILDRLFPYQWSGLYFHPYHLRTEPASLDKKANWRDHDSILLSNNCKAVAIHDRSVAKKFSQRIKKTALIFPETADDTAPDLSNSLYLQIKEKAKGRKVIGMIGCESHKGTLTAMRMAKKADPLEYFFAFLGILPQSTYKQHDWDEAQAFINEQKENCFFHFHSIPEGAAYNAVFCAFDIPFLVYDNFISSSNRLTKAAIFQKLVLASGNYCVGQDVKDFQLGIGIKPGDVVEGLEALDSLTEKYKRSDLPVEMWKRYRELNSVGELKKKLKELISYYN